MSTWRQGTSEVRTGFELGKIDLAKVPPPELNSPFWSKLEACAVVGDFHKFVAH